MALDRFINSVRSEVAKRFDLKTAAEIDAFFIGMEESAKDNQKALEKRDKMLRDTVAELCEAKRLLKLAVEDFNCDIDSICAICKHNDLVDGCPYIERYSECEYKWRYTDEALKLIGGTENGA